MEIPPADTPVVCDLRGTTETPEERIAEYGRLFEHALAGRERTAQGIRFRLHAKAAVEAWVRDLAAREQACCPFFAFDITTTGDEVLWDAAVSDNEEARFALEEMYALPDRPPRIDRSKILQ